MVMRNHSRGVSMPARRRVTRQWRRVESKHERNRREVTTALPTSPAGSLDRPAQVAIRDAFAWDAQDAYLFDIDGTILRSLDRIHYNSFAHSVRQVMSRELLLDGVTLSGNTDPGILRDAFRLARLDNTEWEPLLEEILDIMRTSVLSQREAMKVQVMPGLPAVLEHLHRRGAALGLATGNLEAIGWLKIEIAGLRDWFTFGGFSDRYAVRSEMIDHAAQIARKVAGPEATVCVVGDTPFDVSAAKANSLPVIAVATGRYSYDELLETDPDLCVTTLQDLLDHFLTRAAGLP
jgi:phosphoglycolate phosphatase